MRVPKYNVDAHPAFSFASNVQKCFQDDSFWVFMSKDMGVAIIWWPLVLFTAITWQCFDLLVSMVVIHEVALQSSEKLCHQIALYKDICRPALAIIYMHLIKSALYTVKENLPVLH